MKAGPLKGPRSDSSANFIAVRDSRNRKLRGLWIRGNRYYLQYRLPGEPSARRVPLVKDDRPAANLTEALEARDEILYARRHAPQCPLAVESRCSRQLLPSISVTIDSLQSRAKPDEKRTGKRRRMLRFLTHPRNCPRSERRNQFSHAGLRTSAIFLWIASGDPT